MTDQARGKLERKFRIALVAILTVFTFVLCEGAFRAYDYFTNPYGTSTIDTWIKTISAELQEHPRLGYAFPPNKVRGQFEQADAAGIPNVPEAVKWAAADVVGIGDSYAYLADKTFYEQFRAQSLKYYSLALFGYGPAQYNVMLRDYGLKLHPKMFLYFVYVGNDPGDIRRYESWQASGKGWYAFNGGYYTPIERSGCCWGWRLFAGRAKRYWRNVVSRMSRSTYEALKGVVKRDDAETVFDYVKQAKTMAGPTPLLVLIIPRDAEQKPYMDPIVDHLLELCSNGGISCLDLDPSFGDPQARQKFFATDGHWNELGMKTAWSYYWGRRVAAVVSPQRSAQAR